MKYKSYGDLIKLLQLKGFHLMTYKKNVDSKIMTWCF